jgi:hypothetical protein
MDSSTAKELTSSPVSRMIVIALLTVGSLIFGSLWLMYEKTIDGQQKLHDKSVEFEKYRTTEQLAFNQKQVEFDKYKNKTESELQTLKYKLDTLSVQLEEEKTMLSEKELDKLKYQFSLREQARSQKAEDSLINRMSEFSALGVNLNSDLHCGSKEDKNRFNEAKAKYSEALAIASANELYKKYQHFFFHNSRNSYSACKKS